MFEYKAAAQSPPAAVALKTLGVHELKKHGVEVLVCGQSLARNKYLTSDVASELTVAASAMTVNVNKQLAGYAYSSIH